jgi:transcriptional regulator
LYIPKAFREDRQQVLHSLIRRHSFGTLVTFGDGGLAATHLPFLLDPERGPHGTLLGHLARANPQWESFGESFASGQEALAIFQGPNAYVSPSWYETFLSVPTWNYVAVHAYGLPRLVTDQAALRRILEATVGTYEASFEEPWDMARLPEDYVEHMTKAIVGFEIPIARLEGKRKLSQNRSAADRQGAIDGLNRHGGAPGQAVAELMADSDVSR